MKKKLTVILSMVLSLSLMAGCGTKEEATTEEEVTTEAVTEAEVTEEEEAVATVADASDSDAQWTYGDYTYTGDDKMYEAITTYICDELGKNYEASDVGIPTIIEVSRDDSDPDDIKVWGDFWYETYKLVGDTLETQAGGSYPGCMHLKSNGDAYKVESFDVVEDGSNFTESAKEIFGERYDAFMEAYSNDEVKNSKRIEFISEFVSAYSVPATKMKDYGWDPVDLTVGSDDSADSEVVYMGGLYASDEECDANIALFKSSGTPIVIIQEGENIYYGEYTTEDAKLDDGTEYTKITVEGKTYGYHFDVDASGNVDAATTGIIVDQDGKAHYAKQLDESVAMDMKEMTE